MQYIDYSEYSKDYDKRYSGEMSIREDKAVKKLLERYITPTSKVLDVGSGTGYLLDITDVNTKKYLGIDVNLDMVFQAREKHPDCDFICADITNTEFYHTDFDIVTSLFSIPYIRIKSIEPIYEALADNGYFIAVYYNKPYRNKDSVYHKRALRYWLTVKPNVMRFINYLNDKMICVEEGDLTDDKTYKYAVFMKGEE